ncbi:MAG TPA: cyclic nucleotide-binding domain-containing protein [Deltaproteobacteria bacterium]|nr:MAG: hypothetical protein DRG59_09720 [Deltaproteobacteria bacterium]RLB05468.1 MAG: hypothetical protein DRG83_02550 [Deltaproteobacteria bacterium]HDM77098.1 cyclic nucleotide-binding domain-containing protein [Deltaproteobacteria bacterium]HEC30981.1 cyclic nucleotide-binding domain-containing protein [Deltaproteobacteria bacterium]
MIDISELKESGYFSDFSDSDLAELAVIGTATHWQEGEIIFQQGSPAKNFFILKKGTVLLCFPSGRSLHLKNGGHGIGWSSLVSPFRYTATGICLTDTTLIQFSGTELYSLIRMNADFGHKLMAKIARTMEERKKYRV